MGTSTLHASAVLLGRRAALIRGPSGSGKSRLILMLIAAADAGLLPFARLVADDRCHVDVAHGRLLVRPVAALAGLLEVRGLGLRQLSFEPVALVGMVIDLSAGDARRLPVPEAQVTTVAGITLPRLAVAAGIDPTPLVLAALRTEPFAKEGSSNR